MIGYLAPLLISLSRAGRMPTPQEKSTLCGRGILPVLENGARCECETIAPFAPSLPPVSPLSPFSPSQRQVFEPRALARNQSPSRLYRL